MNKTDIFFSKLIEDKEKAIHSKKDIEVSRAKLAIMRKFADLYVDEGYDMLLQECAELLDVEEKWLVRVFGHEFDYFVAPSPATQIFAGNKVFSSLKLCEKLGYVKIEGLEAQVLDMHNQSWLKKTKDERVGLSRKRVFVNRQSFYEFMKQYLTVVNEFKKVVVPREKLKNLSNTKLDKLTSEMLVTFGIGELDKNGKVKFYEQSGLIQDQHFDKILSHKLFSGKSIKEYFVSARIESSLITKVHDTQLYRWLSQVNVTKITLKPENNKVPVVRYLFPFSINEELGLLRYDDKFSKENYIFNIPSHMDEEEVIEKLIFYVEFLDSEKLIDKDKDSCSK